MKREERVKFWVKNADESLEMMNFLFKNRKNVDALFYGSLAVEKLMKGYYVSKKTDAPPFVHDLVFIARKAGMEITVELAKDFKIISGFNINARYDDYKESLHKEATREYTMLQIELIKMTYLWIKEQI